MTMRAPLTDLPILLDDVSLIAGGVTILDRISLAVTAGSPTVLVGPNGAGKTTLLRLIMGLLPPMHGRVTWGVPSTVPPPTPSATGRPSRSRSARIASRASAVAAASPATTP